MKQSKSMLASPSSCRCNAFSGPRATLCCRCPASNSRWGRRDDHEAGGCPGPSSGRCSAASGHPATLRCRCPASNPTQCSTSACKRSHGVNSKLFTRALFADSLWASVVCCLLGAVVSCRRGSNQCCDRLRASTAGCSLCARSWCLHSQLAELELSAARCARLPWFLNQCWALL